jgi:hypothetical protein
VGMLCFLREQGGYSDEEIARKLHFDSVEDMRAQLRRWVWTYPGSVDTFLSCSVLFSQSNLLELSRA